MAWYDEAVFYHIYPLGLTGAPKQNSYGEPEHRLNTLLPWISHIKSIGCNALYIGPLFESVGHGYETTDYKKLDSRLGTNEDLTNFVAKCHKEGIRVILDGVFNHTGRDFFAFKDIQQNRENSRYKDWYCNVNFWGNTEYNDGFSYENWGGYNLLVKLNQHNPEVQNYICDVIRFWVSEFDIDGIRLDAADVLDFNYMQCMRRVANEVKPDFWLMGEVIHGDYNRWANENTLHSVTNYHLHKALYSGHNDYNYFEIAHTVKRLNDMGGLKLYNFVDNHDVERIWSKLINKNHFPPVHILLYTLPGIPSVYYGSEFGIEGKKERFSDDSLRPALQLSNFPNAPVENPQTRLITALGKLRQNTPALSYGEYKELLLTNCQYAFARNYNGQSVIITVNNANQEATFAVAAGNCTEYVGALSGSKLSANNGSLTVTLKTCSGEIWIPADEMKETYDVVMEPVVTERKEYVPQKEIVTEEALMNVAEEPVENIVIKPELPIAEPHPEVISEQIPEPAKAPVAVPNKPYEEMTVEELQAAIIERMAKNGPVTEQMKKDVTENIWHDSLVTWIKSFN
ncbi:MAG: alpha-glucosidase C-terminal domain-containing protein [Lachnospiraceae bacterium]|nr:alpha-glucosidase C-terminal domain-containing protein [Lachnospiraceae bacterium]